jgi:hypothetical protein
MARWHQFKLYLGIIVLGDVEKVKKELVMMDGFSLKSVKIN